MSAIPPNIISAIATPAAQREHARHIDSVRQATIETSKKLTGAADALVEVEIEATDADTQVHTDSGGMGSQGRYDATPEEPTETLAKPDGIVVDASGQTHIDLSV